MLIYVRKTSIHGEQFCSHPINIGFVVVEELIIVNVSLKPVVYVGHEYFRVYSLDQVEGVPEKEDTAIIVVILLRH